MYAQLCSGESRVNQGGHAPNGGSKISQTGEGDANPRGGGVSLLFDQIYAKSVHGNEGYWTEKGARFPSAPLDQPMP